MTWWVWVVVIPLVGAFCWSIGMLQGKGSMALDLAEMRQHVDILTQRLARALADVEALRAAPLDHGDSVTVLRDVSAGSDAEPT